MSKPRLPREVGRWVLDVEARAVAGLIAQLDESFDRAVELLHAARGPVVCTGMGKSGLVMRKVAATLASTGTPALFLHPAEAIHGDLGMIAEGDVVLAASSSVTTEELLRLVDAPLERTTGECMTRGPRTVEGGALASSALKLMEEHRVTSLFVCDAEGRLEGVVHLHDLWRLELF